MLDLFFILHFTYLGCAHTPNAPHAYGRDCGAIEKHLHTYLLTYLQTPCSDNNRVYKDRNERNISRTTRL